MTSKTNCTTHADGCYGWGPRHYDCAAREIERLERELTVERQTRQRLEDIHQAAMEMWRAESPVTEIEMENHRLKCELAEAREASWRAAITLANNLCVQISDRANEEDDIDRACAASTCARRIREYLNIPDTERNELIAECAGILADPPAERASAEQP